MKPKLQLVIVDNGKTIHSNLNDHEKIKCVECID